MKYVDNIILEKYPSNKSHQKVKTVYERLWFWGTSSEKVEDNLTTVYTFDMKKY